MRLKLIFLALFSGVLKAEWCPNDGSFIIPKQHIPSSISNYPFKETALQIFTQLRIPCNAWLIEWQFLAAEAYVYGLHLGVFRPVQGGKLQLVGDTFLQSLNTPHHKKGTWVYYPVPQPIEVHAGDLIGIFYANYKVSAESVAVVSNRLVLDNQSIPVTFIYLKDGSTFKLGEMLDVTDATVEHRLPALMAKLSRDTPPALLSDRETTTFTTMSLVPLELNSKATDGYDFVTSGRLDGIDTTPAIDYYLENNSFGATISVRIRPTVQEVRPAVNLPTLVPLGLFLPEALEPVVRKHQPQTTTSVDLNWPDIGFVATTETYNWFRVPTNFQRNLQNAQQHNLVEIRSSLNLHLNLANNGAVACSPHRLNTTLMTFSSSGACLRYAGDRKQMCKGPVGKFVACVDSTAHCEQMKSAHVKMHESAGQCYTYIGLSFDACLHYSANGQLFCAPYTINAKRCYSNNLFCQMGISNN